MTSEVRIGIVGVGRWGERQLRASQGVSGARVTALCDQLAGRLRGRMPRVPTYGDLDSLIAARVADALVVATPTATHSRVAERALAHGYHVLVEKPLALSVDEAFRVAHAATRANRVAMVGHLLEHHPEVHSLEVSIREGHLGALVRLESRRLATRVAQGDDPWWTLAPHDVSLALRLAGPAHCARFVGERCGRECFELEHTSGALTWIEVGFGCPAKVRELRVVGERTTALFDDTLPAAMPSPLERQLAAFVAAIRTGRAPEHGSIEQGVEVVRWLEAGARSRARARRGAA